MFVNIVRHEADCDLWDNQRHIARDYHVFIACIFHVQFMIGYRVYIEKCGKYKIFDDVSLQVIKVIFA